MHLNYSLVRSSPMKVWQILQLSIVLVSPLSALSAKAYDLLLHHILDEPMTLRMLHLLWLRSFFRIKNLFFRLWSSRIWLISIKKKNYTLTSLSKCSGIHWQVKNCSKFSSRIDTYLNAFSSFYNKHYLKKKASPSKKKKKQTHLKNFNTNEWHIVNSA